jgi:aminoglycoside phosphotransferase (APT) family kinase protein
VNDWTDELRDRLAELYGPLELDPPRLLAGGSSKEAWAVDAHTADGEVALFLRRAAGGVIHEDTLPLADEYRVLEAAFAAGVHVPEPYAYLGELGGREAFLQQRVAGETIGSRIVRRPELAGARAALPAQLGVELAAVHAIDPAAVPFLDSGDVLARFEHELDSVGEPHPAIELGLRWLADNRPEPLPAVVSHGDFRLGNIVVTEQGFEFLLDWEFAHLGDPRDDLAWPLVRAWRFGADERRLGGVGDAEPYVERYAELTGRVVAVDDLFWWEVLGNVKWAVGALTQSRRHLNGQERSVELAVLGRLAAEMEYELLDLLERAA